SRRSPSGIYIIGFVRSWPLLAPVVVSKSNGLPLIARACEFTRNTGIALMERIAILCPEVREHPALSPFFSIPEKANKRVKRVNSQALAVCRGEADQYPHRLRAVR